MKPQWLSRELLTGPYMTLCTTEDMFHSELKELKVKKSEYPSFLNPTSNATVHFLTHEDYGMAAIVCFPTSSGIDPIEVAGLLVHEAVHIWQEYLIHIGEKYPGVETEAYAIQRISMGLMSEYSRQVISS